MGKLIDLLSIVLLLAAIAAFAVGMIALGAQQDLAAMYWLVVGGLVLKASVDLLRPGGAA